MVGTAGADGGEALMPIPNTPATRPEFPPAKSAQPGHPDSVFTFSTQHRVIGRQYFFLSLAAVLIGMVLSLLMRLHIVWPEMHIPLLGQIKPEQYLAYMTMHGTLMVFFVLSVAPQNAFGNLVLPQQIGARRMAFPRLNMLSFWTTLLSFVVMVSALFVTGGGSMSGWTQYPPLSAITSAGAGQGLGTDLWIASVSIFCVGSLMSAVNFI